MVAIVASPAIGYDESGTETLENDERGTQAERWQLKRDERGTQAERWQLKSQK